MATKMVSGASISFSSSIDVPPGLNALDNLLRCPICFEFFDTAMLLPGCSHNYCSLCIRKYLTFKKQCPSCTTHVTDSMLKNNRLVDEIITKFTQLRSSLIPRLKIGSPVKPDVLDVTPTQTKLKKKTVSSSKKKTTKTLQQFYASKTKAEKNDSDDDDVQILDTQSQAAKSSATAETSPTVTPTSKSQRLEKVKKNPLVGIVKPLDFEDADDDFVKKTQKLRSPMSARKRRASSQRTPKGPCPVKSISADMGTEEYSQPSTSQPSTSQPSTSQPSTSQASRSQASSSQASTSRSGELITVEWSELSALSPQCQGEKSESTKHSRPNSRPVTPSSQERVTCPVCGTELREGRMNAHLDLCLSSGEKKGALRKKLLSDPPPRQPPALRRRSMHKLVYTLLSEKDIKAKLREVGLSTKGERHVLVRRHQEFTLAYNAQCDALNPKSAKQIAAEMERNESLKCDYKENPPENQTLKIEKGASAEQIEKAQQTYVKQHKSQFDELVRMARRKMKPKVGRRTLAATCTVESPGCQTRGDNMPVEVTGDTQTDVAMETVSRSVSRGAGDSTTTVAADAGNSLGTFGDRVGEDEIRASGDHGEITVSSGQQGEIIGDSWPPLSQRTRERSTSDVGSESSSPLQCFIDHSQSQPEAGPSASPSPLLHFNLKTEDSSDCEDEPALKRHKVT